jgi:hypothetical protein
MWIMSSLNLIQSQTLKMLTFHTYFTFMQTDEFSFKNTLKFLLWKFPNKWNYSKVSQPFLYPSPTLNIHQHFVIIILLVTLSFSLEYFKASSRSPHFNLKHLSLHFKREYKTSKPLSQLIKLENLWYNQFPDHYH